MKVNFKIQVRLGAWDEANRSVTQMAIDFLCAIKGLEIVAGKQNSSCNRIIKKFGGVIEWLELDKS